MKRITPLKKYAPAIVFCAFIAVMTMLFWALPKQDFSPDEKRVLESPPSFTLKSLSDGSFGKSVENYLSDHFAGRKLFVGLNAYYNLFSGRNGAGDIYLGNDSYLINQPVVFDQEKLQKNVDDINAFVRSANVPAVMAVVPSTGYVMEKSLPAVHKPYHDGEILDALSASLDTSVQFVDFRSPFLKQREQAQLYYKTDHHWTSEGAYLGYHTLGTALGYTPGEPAQYQIERYEGFYGTTYSHSGYWLTAPDAIEIWKNPSLTNLSVRIEETGKPAQESNSLFFPSHLEETDKYPVFLDGNHGYTKITNADAPKGKLLLIKDSFGHCLAPFLAEQYKEIYMVDLRYYKTALTRLIKEEEIDQILILYGLDNMVNDTNFMWLK